MCSRVYAPCCVGSNILGTQPTVGWMDVDCEAGRIGYPTLKGIENPAIEFAWQRVVENPVVCELEGIEYPASVRLRVLGYPAACVLNLKGIIKYPIACELKCPTVQADGCMSTLLYVCWRVSTLLYVN